MTQSASTSQQLIVLLHSRKMAAWLLAPGQAPQMRLIKGEKQLNVRDPNMLHSATQDLQESLRGEHINIQHTCWVADHEGRADCFSANIAPNWQLPWEWLATRFSLSTAPWADLPVLEAQLLPWLAHTDDSALRQHQQQQRETEHATESERLNAERNRLALENEHLKQQNAALKQVDRELLISFLPALYTRAFTVIGPVDLAALCGRIQPADIPSPYPEPTEEALRTLQKRFRALPPPTQQEIVSFVHQLPHAHRLDVRREMRELVGDLLDQAQGR